MTAASRPRGEEAQSEPLEALRAARQLRRSTEQHGVGEQPVVDEVEEVGRVRVLPRVGGGLDGRVHVRDADAAGDRYRPQGIDREAVGAQDVAHRADRSEELGASRGVHPEGIAVEDHGRGLVEGDPVGDPIAERLPRSRGELREAVGGVPTQPAAAFLERRRSVPVEEGHDGRDVGLEQTVDHAVVVGHGLRVHRSPAVGEQPRPGE